jgi:undecaprenyl-diphosphatase
MQRLLWWSRLHPLAGRIPASLLDPELPEARGLTLLALLLLGATLLFSVVMVALGEGAGLLDGLDYSLHHTLQQLRTPAMDRLMMPFAQLGEIGVLLALSLLVLLWLLHCGLRRAALHWLAAGGVGALLGLALFALGHQLHAEALTRHAAANSLLLGLIACLGFLAVLIARELSLRHRWWVYALTGVLLLTIAFARLYLGIQHLGALIGVLLLGLAWVALLGIGYRNHPAERVAPLPLLLLAVMVITTGMAWQSPPRLEAALQRYATSEVPITLSPAQWLGGSPETTPPLPAFRADLRGLHSHPLNLQYAGALDPLRQSLMAAGWRLPPEVDTLSWLAWLNPDTPLAQMPVLSQVHDGRYHELLLSREVDGRLLALRLWRSPYQLVVAAGEQQELWLGNISHLAAESRGGLTVPRTQQGFDEALRILSLQLAANPAITLYPPASRGAAQAVLRFTLRGTLRGTRRDS